MGQGKYGIRARARMPGQLLFAYGVWEGRRDSMVVPNQRLQVAAALAISVCLARLFNCHSLVLGVADEYDEQSIANEFGWPSRSSTLGLHSPFSMAMRSMSVAL